MVCYSNFLRTNTMTIQKFEKKLFVWLFSTRPADNLVLSAPYPWAWEI